MHMRVLDAWLAQDRASCPEAWIETGTPKPRQRGLVCPTPIQSQVKKSGSRFKHETKGRRKVKHDDVLFNVCPPSSSRSTIIVCPAREGFALTRPGGPRLESYEKILMQFPVPVVM